MKTILIAGLGNPGKEYAKTRHNSGFMFVDYFLEKYCGDFGFSEWEEKKKLKSAISVGKFAGKKIILAKPQTFMNLSGEAVKALIKYYKIELSDLFVVHDEIDLILGKYKLSTDSSSAGHKGAQNIIDALGTKNFTRLRIGVNNREDKKIATEKYVLGKFLPSEMKMVSEVILESSEKLKRLISKS
jgi:peptidyl-tRNA hydrolase, PTH1 family